MKKIIVILAAALMAGSAAFAQSKGDMYAGGGLSFGAGSASEKQGTTTTKGTVPTTFAITPSFGYFILDNVRVGGSLTLDLAGQSHGSGNSKVKNNETTFLIGPEAAYYLRIADNLYYTPELGLYGGVASKSYKAGNTKESVSGGAFCLGLSLAQVEFRATDKLAFGVDLMNLQYLTTSYKVDDYNSSGEKVKSKVASSTFKFNINATLSVKYYF